MINRVFEIARYCKVVFGLDKTKHMILGKDPDPERMLRLGEDEIEKVTEYKYLGIMVNRQLI